MERSRGQSFRKQSILSSVKEKSSLFLFSLSILYLHFLLYLTDITVSLYLLVSAMLFSKHQNNKIYYYM